MKSLVLRSAGGSIYSWSKLGDVIEIPDEEAYYFLSSCGDMLKEVKRERKASAEKVEKAED